MKTSSGPPESFGWQRRPDLDTPAGDAYEAPDGGLKLFQKGRKPELVRLQIDPLEKKKYSSKQPVKLSPG